MDIQKKHFYIKIQNFNNDNECLDFLKDLDILDNILTECKSQIPNFNEIKFFNKDNIIWIKLYNEGVINIIYKKSSKEFSMLEIFDFENNSFKKEFWIRKLKNYVVN
jgi:hypothetical protein